MSTRDEIAMINQAAQGIDSPTERATFLGALCLAAKKGYAHFTDAHVPHTQNAIASLDSQGVIREVGHGSNMYRFFCEATAGLIRRMDIDPNNGLVNKDSVAA